MKNRHKIQKPNKIVSDLIQRAKDWKKGTLAAVAKREKVKLIGNEGDFIADVPSAIKPCGEFKHKKSPGTTFRPQPRDIPHPPKDYRTSKDSPVLKNQDESKS